MSIQIEDVQYRLPNGEYYIGTSNMDKEGKCFLIQDDYSASDEFVKDFIKTLIYKYPKVLEDYILANGEFSDDLDCFNDILSTTNAWLFLADICDDTSRCFIDKEKLTKYYESGVFEELNCNYTKVIYVVGT